MTFRNRLWGGTTGPYTRDQHDRREECLAAVAEIAWRAAVRIAQEDLDAELAVEAGSVD